MIIKKREALRILAKFSMPIRPGGKELIAKFEDNGIVYLYARVPKGDGDLQCTGKFRKSLHLDEVQLRESIRCPFKREHLIINLREKGVMP